MSIMAEPNLKTDRLGGVDVPSADTLRTMHNCILSVVSSSQAGNSWKAARDNTDFYAIRWCPVERSKA